MVHINDENLVTRNSTVTNVDLQPSLIWYSDVVYLPTTIRYNKAIGHIFLTNSIKEKLSKKVVLHRTITK